MQVVKESPDVPAAVHISHGGLQAHVSEAVLSCWCADASILAKFMKDSVVRGRLLQLFYERRSEGFIPFGRLPGQRPLSDVGQRVNLGMESKTSAESSKVEARK